MPVRTVRRVLKYAWDSDKEAINVRKRGIDFLEARTVLQRRLTVTWFDEAHSLDEPRFKTIGYSALGRLLVVVTSDDGVQPRIISAWRATKRERDAYERRR